MAVSFDVDANMQEIFLKIVVRSKCSKKCDPVNISA